MGYTHYWYVKDLEAVRRALPLVAKDLKTLLPHLPPLAGPDGTGKPLLGEKILFNGPAPEGDYETFHLSPREKDYTRTERGLFRCCKTGIEIESARPYDLAVRTALVLLKWHAGAEAVRVSTDGNLVVWSEATGLVEKHLGYPVDPFWVLEKEVWEVRDARGKVFYKEVKRDWHPTDKPEDPLCMSTDELLRELSGMGYIPYRPPFQYRGPLAVLEVPGKPLAPGSTIYASSRP